MLNEEEKQKQHDAEYIPIAWLMDKIDFLRNEKSLTAHLARVTLEVTIQQYYNELIEREGNEKC